MIDTCDDQIDQIIERHQAPFVVNRPKRQGYAAPKPMHHVEEIGLDTRAIDQRGTNDHHFHASLQGYFT